MSFYIPNDTCQIKEIGNIYEKVFGQIFDGTFVEVGAFDGEWCSNTNFLGDLGWNGIYIEPYFPTYQQCFNRHYNNNVNVICCSVGTVEGEIELYQSFSHSNPTNKLGFSYLTTTNIHQTERIPQINWSNHVGFNKSTCQQYTLERILTENNVPKNFDILVVDVEGNEEDVINSFSIEVWKPKMMIIEIEDENRHYQKFTDFVENCKKFRTKILNYGYRQIYKDDINTVFIDTGLDIPL